MPSVAAAQIMSFDPGSLPSVLVVRENRQGMKFDALFAQLFCFFRRCFAVDRAMLGLASGGALALAVIGFRGAILSLGLADYVMAATFTLVVGLAIQSAALSLYLSLRRPTVMFALLRAWKPSLFAGFMGALASQF